jgi:hypothetical protein
MNARETFKGCKQHLLGDSSEISEDKNAFRNVVSDDSTQEVSDRNKGSVGN